MTVFKNALTTFASFAALTLPCWAQMQAAPAAPGSNEQLQVIDIVIVSTNRVTVGTNTMSLAAATNYMATHREDVDIVAVHGSLAGEDSGETKSSTVEKLARVGVPLVIVEKDGEYAWREQSSDQGIRTVQIGTAQFASLRRLWTRQNSAAGEASEPVLRTTVLWDTDTGSYELNRVELGLFGKHVWIMHEQRETDEDAGTVGIQLKKEW